MENENENKTAENSRYTQSRYTLYKYMLYHKKKSDHEQRLRQ